MITSHSQFIDAIHARERVRLTYYSRPDSGTVDRECAPLDYGPAPGAAEPINQYWVWDYAALEGARLLGLMPEQILQSQVLGLGFDPATMDFGGRIWSVPRTWECAPASDAVPPPAAPRASS